MNSFICCDSVTDLDARNDINEDTRISDTLIDFVTCYDMGAIKKISSVT